MGGTCSTHESCKIETVWLESLKETDHSEDRRIILKWILGK
jgi:hypothetical protein